MSAMTRGTSLIIKGDNFTITARLSGLCRLQLQPLNISWTTVTEPALAASPSADQLQTRQTLLPGYFFPTARLPC